MLLLQHLFRDSLVSQPELAACSSQISKAFDVVGDIQSVSSVILDKLLQRQQEQSPVVAKYGHTSVHTASWVARIADVFADTSALAVCAGFCARVPDSLELLAQLRRDHSVFDEQIKVPQPQALDSQANLSAATRAAPNLRQAVACRSVFNCFPAYFQVSTTFRSHPEGITCSLATVLTSVIGHRRCG